MRSRHSGVRAGHGILAAPVPHHVIEILDVHLGGSEYPRLGPGSVGHRQPEVPDVLVPVDNVNAVDPERRVVGRAALQVREVLCVHPGSAPNLSSPPKEQRIINSHTCRTPEIPENGFIKSGSRIALHWV
jgi:hypothetical protein